MPNNNAVRRILAKRLGLPRGSSWGDIRRETHRIKRDLGLPRGTSISAICRRVERDRWFEVAYNRLQDRIYEGMSNEGEWEVWDICDLAVSEVRHRGFPQLETKEDFFRLVLGTTTMVLNFLSGFRYMDQGDVPLEEEIYLLLAYSTWKGMEDGDLERFREYARSNSVPELFRLDLNEDILPLSMVGTRLPRYYDSEEEDRIPYEDEDEDMGRYSEDEDDFLYGPVPENSFQQEPRMRFHAPDMVG